MSQKSRKRKQEGEDQTMVEYEQDNFFSNEMKKEMETMWEIPQIFQFLHLTKESLNIPQLSIYELERMLSIPRASKQLANIMTCLLSSPITKAKLSKVPPMPYEFWTNILAHKVTSWFKIYHAKHKDAIKVLETIGVEPEFWNIFPDASSLAGKDFDELSFKQRIWLLKTICDTIMHTRKTVQEDIAKQPLQDQFERILGVDRYGARYIYFPQFILTDLRIYRHCLDNKVIGSQQETSLKTNDFVETGLNRYRKRKSQSRNNLFRRSNRRNSNSEDKDFKCSNDSAMGSFISEDTNLSSTSTCSNNNNISLDTRLDTLGRKRRRSLSKMSEESILSNETESSNARSSGYDTNTSSDNKSMDEPSQEMFKGFSNTNEGNCNYNIITEILDELKSEIDKEKGTYVCGDNSSSSENNSGLLLMHKNSVQLYKNAVSSYVETQRLGKDALRDETEKSIDNLSSSSKTDDEKLNEIISAESSKLPETICSKNISTNDNVSHISSSSKSDDEKLNETQTAGSNTKENVAKNSLNKDISFNGSVRATSNKKLKSSGEEILQSTAQAVSHILFPEESSRVVRNLRKRTKLRSRYKTTQHNKKKETETLKNRIKEIDMKEDTKNNKNFVANERILDDETAKENLGNYISDSDIDYNLRGSKDLSEDESKQHFNKMLSDLSVSDFQLVADSVDGLRNLISHFSRSDSGSNNIDDMEPSPLCEMKLANELIDLLNSLEKMETTLKDTMRKARSKLQREWSNFKEGSMEDQDSSGESGLGSNWWVIGSQGCPLSAPGDATLQTLSQSALSPLGSQKQHSPFESKHENQGKGSESSQCSNQEHIEQGSREKPEVAVQREKAEEEEQEREHRESRETETASNNEGAEQQTRRVLRTRGVSSYTEQFYSDDESDENQLEEWTDVEAIYAAPGAQADTSTSYAGAKIRNTDEWSEKEDSDQDWILPSSRKRKNKRSSSNRRLKSFQYKLQNIIDDKDKPKDNEEIAELGMQKSGSSQLSSDSTVNEPALVDDGSTKQVMPSTCMETTSKDEIVHSVHSELDIKDEGPIYESNYYENNCDPNLQNYLMIKTEPSPTNYYVMQQNPVNIVSHGPLMHTGTFVSSIAPTIQQGYYLQSAQNYIIQNPQSNSIPIQQPIFQQQDASVIMTQPVANNLDYTPYMIATTQSQTKSMIAPGPPTTNLQNLQSPIHSTPRPQNRSNQNNKYTMLRQNLPHFNGAVIRSSTPIRGSYRRSQSAAKFSRNNVIQQRAPNPKAVARQRQTPQIATKNTEQKTTSLIVLSDSDDEIEMIITEKTNVEKDNGEQSKASPVTGNKEKPIPRNINQAKQKPTIKSDITVSTTKNTIPPQIIQRMSQGGISITPVKSAVPPASGMNTQLVVVVNETGSHYALALPNGSKLILTPEQVAQIRASNGGKLIL